MTKIKVGVVGVGHLGRQHLRLYNDMPEVECVAFCDTNVELIDKYSKKYNIPGFTDYRELFGQVEAVSIVVPTEMHYKISADFLNHGVDVLVEKPVTTTVEEAEELLAIAENRQRILQVGHVERFNKAILTLKNEIKYPMYIESQRLGPYTPRIKDVGVVLDLMIHDIDIILSIVGSPIIQIDAVGMKVLSDREDIATAHIIFKNGCVANISASRITKEKIRKLRVFEKDSYYSIDYADQAITIQKLDKENKRIVSHQPKIEKDEPLRLELEHFIKCVKKGRNPIVTGKQGKDALKIAFEILKRIEFGNIGINESSVNKIMIVAGEASGDMHGAYLVKELKKLKPTLEIFGVGGPKMAEAGVEIYTNILDMAVMGIFEAIKNIRPLHNLIKELDVLMKIKKPDKLILIDYSGFNLKLAEIAKKQNVKSIYYICPQVWAWRKYRIKKIAALIEKVVAVFPFEVNMYKKAKANVSFFGHPLIDIVKPLMSREEARQYFGLDDSSRLICLLPGSRKEEIKRLLPIMLSASEILNKKIKNLKFVIALANTAKRCWVEKEIQRHTLNVQVVESMTYDVINASDFAMVVSGTATLETAILNVPMVILYKTSIFTEMFLRVLLSLKYIGLCNILAGKLIVPELLQRDANSVKLAEVVSKFLTSEELMKKVKWELSNVVRLLGEPGVIKKVARMILLS